MTQDADFGDAAYTCAHCQAKYWYGERTVRRSSINNPRFSTCCSERKVVLPLLFHPPPLLTELMDYNGGERYKGLTTKQKRWQPDPTGNMQSTTLDRWSSDGLMVVLWWLIGGQPPLTAINHYRPPPLTVVDRWSGDGSSDDAIPPPPLTAIDHYRPPPLTVVDRWSGDGSSDDARTVIMPRGTTHVVTRGHLMIRMLIAGPMFSTRWQQAWVR
nr:hypothetical protein CTI12_AA301630 [Tanacetum cinerariifolium]